VKAEALAANAPKEPLIERPEGTDSVYNDPALAQRLRTPLEAALGKENVITTEPIAPSEDYSAFIQAGVPSLYFSLGGADPKKFAETKGAEGGCPPSLSVFRAGRGSRAARGYQGGSCRVAESAERKRANEPDFGGGSVVTSRRPVNILQIRDVMFWENTFQPGLFHIALLF